MLRLCLLLVVPPVCGSLIPETLSTAPHYYTTWATQGNSLPLKVDGAAPAPGHTYPKGFERLNPFPSRIQHSFDGRIHARRWLDACEPDRRLDLQPPGQNTRYAMLMLTIRLHHGDPPKVQTSNATTPPPLSTDTRTHIHARTRREHGILILCLRKTRSPGVELVRVVLTPIQKRTLLYA
jgi:hypothetical protein